MPMTPGEINDRMPVGTQRELAAQLQVSPAYVSRVVQQNMEPRGPRGRKTMRRVQVAIARRIGLKVDEVFTSIMTQSDRPEHARHDRRDMLGRGESRARAVGAGGSG